MTEPQDPRRQQYDRARHAFDDLSIEDKTFFLIKETINTIAEGVETAVQTVAHEFGTIFGEAPPHEAPPAAQPNAEASAAQASKAKKTSTRKKTTGAKGKTTTKRTSTRKTTSKKDTSDDAS